MSESVEFIEGNLPTHEVVQDIPTNSEDMITAKVLCLKVLLSPQTCTLEDLARLQELLISLGYM